MIPPQGTSFKYGNFAGGLRRLESSVRDNPLVLALPTIMSGPTLPMNTQSDEYVCLGDKALLGRLEKLS
jgi:hypothetical protein